MKMVVALRTIKLDSNQSSVAPELWELEILKDHPHVNVVRSVLHSARLLL